MIIYRAHQSFSAIFGNLQDGPLTGKPLQYTNLGNRFIYIGMTRPNPNITIKDRVRLKLPMDGLTTFTDFNPLY